MDIDLFGEAAARKVNKVMPLASSGHTSDARQHHDYYATDPIAIEKLLELEKFSNVWEPACGEGHLSKVLIDKGIHGKSSDLIDRGFGSQYDFLSIHNKHWDGDIITNPPFKHATGFIEKSLEIMQEGSRAAMFLKIQFLESADRRKLFKNNPPVLVYVASARIRCAKNGDFKALEKSGGAVVCYAWFIWQKGFTGETTLKWFN